MVARRVSHFEIIEVVGEGGSGIVYKARDLLLPRFVALKFLSSRLLNSPAAVESFWKEARLISTLSHPNIEIIYEVGQHNGSPFLVLEYLPGGSLAARLRDCNAARAPFALPDLLDCAIQIADGLAYAHRHGIVHRDLKPGNILCSAEHVVKITDFGIAKLVTADASTTGVRGTIPYMSPEQIDGCKLDHRTDLYSFGVVLFELATGRRPFEGETSAAVLAAILAGRPVSMRALRPSLPPELGEIGGRLLARDPGQRPERMEPVVEQLRAIRSKYAGSPPLAGLANTLDEDTVSAEVAPVEGDPTAPLTAQPRPRRRRLLAASLAAVVAVTVAVGAWPYRCLLMPGVLDACRIPARRHVGILDLQAFDGAQDDVLATGLTSYAAAGLGRLARFQDSLCVHRVDPADASVVDLNIRGSVRKTGDSMRIDLELRRSRPPLLMRRIRVEPNLRDASALQDDFVLLLAGLVGGETGSREREAVSGGGTAIRRAFDAYVRGLGYMELRQTEEAVAAMETALREDPYYISAAAGLAEALRRRYHETGDVQLLSKARSVARDSLRQEGAANTPELHRAFGLAAFDLRDTQAAMEALRQAVRIDPLNHSVREDLARCLLIAGLTDEVETLYKDAVQRRPDCYLALHNLGEFYRRHGRLKEAQHYFRQVVAQAPESASAWTNLGAVAHQLQLWGEAEGSYRKALDLQASSVIYANLGQLYLENGCFRDAALTLERAVELDEADYVAWGNEAEACLMVPEFRSRAPGAFLRALQLARERRIRYPEDPQVLRLQAFYHARLGQPREALEGIRAALELAKDDVNTLYRAGFLYELVHDRERAIDAFRRALEGGYSATREVCGHPDLASLRADPRFAGVLSGRCPDQAAAATAGGASGFVCPENPGRRE